MTVISSKDRHRRSKISVMGQKLLVLSPGISDSFGRIIAEPTPNKAPDRSARCQTTKRARETAAKAAAQRSRCDMPGLGEPGVRGVEHLPQLQNLADLDFSWLAKLFS